MFCGSAVSKAMTGAYGGMTDESGGVVSLLETISADFSRLEADTKAEERNGRWCYGVLFFRRWCVLIFIDLWMFIKLHAIGIKYTYSLHFYCPHCNLLSIQVLFLSDCASMSIMSVNQSDGSAKCPEVWSPCAVSSKESSAAGEFDKWHPQWLDSLCWR